MPTEIRGAARLVSFLLFDGIADADSILGVP
jgi:hypothetical protein